MRYILLFSLIAICVSSQCNNFVNNAYDYALAYNSTHSLRFNVCRGLITNIVGCEGATMCLRAPTGTTSTIISTSMGFFRDGQLLFTTTNGTVTATINFACALKTSIEPVLISKSPLSLLWYSPYGCAPTPPCVLSSPTGQVNITNLGVDQMIVSPSFSQYKDLSFLFNACKPLNRTLCPPGAYACLTVQDSLGSHYLYTLGTAQSLMVVNGVLTVLLTGGSPCGALGTFHSLEVRFICGYNNVPPYYELSSLCHHRITWLVPDVCGF